MSTPPSFQPSSRPHSTGKRRPRPHLEFPRTSLTVVIVTLSSGLLFGMSAANARQGDATSGELADLVRHRHQTVQELQNAADDLQSAINQLINDNTSNTSSTLDTPLTLQPLTGPGITVTLSDAPPGPIPENATPDDLVIHQQDIENVINALWAGGAEAITIQNKRVANTTEIRCIGNVIYIDGSSYSPPYTISAIGDPTTMTDALNTDRAIEIYQAYVAAYGLGWKLEKSEKLELPAAGSDFTAQHAQIME